MIKIKIQEFTDKIKKIKDIKYNDLANIQINNIYLYLLIAIVFFISNSIFNIFSYYFIILYPGYLTMNLVICNKFTLNDYHIENRETDGSMVIDKVLTENKIIKYNHILCYWLLFALMFFFEHFIFIFKFIIPLYPIFKMIFIVWYLIGDNYRRKNEIFYDFLITPIYQYILNIKYELFSKIKKG